MDPVHRFSMFVRKDVAAQVWDWGAAPAAAAAAVGGSVRGGQREIAALQQIGTAGQPGTGRGSSTSRGRWRWGPTARSTWRTRATTGSRCSTADGNVPPPVGQHVQAVDTRRGLQGDGQGQFNEPWGIAVGADGSVYVSDTWNHRIQKFDAAGQFVTMWGIFGPPAGSWGSRTRSTARARWRSGRTATCT